MNPMVSTRKHGIDKFTRGERVLCYEPDRTKARVLYESKVLEVRGTKDDRGRRSLEYLIHFQGWNATWDRVVSEDFLLKDTDENRQLQRELAARAKLQAGSYLYRKISNSEKDHNCISEKVAETTSNSGSALNASSIDDEHDDYLTCTTDEDKESSVATDDLGDNKLPLELPHAVQIFLQTDADLIKNQNKLLRLPSSPTVIQILEGYVRYMCARGLRRDPEEKSSAKGARQATAAAVGAPDLDEAEWALAKMALIKEIVDGLRICFDFYIGTQLLYNSELQQYEEIRNGTKVYIVKEMKHEVSSEEDVAKTDECATTFDAGDGDRRRSLRSHKDPVLSMAAAPPVNGSAVDKLTMRSIASIGGQGSGNSVSARSTSSGSSYCGPSPISRDSLLLPNWSLVPNSYLYQHPQPPSTVYGAIHLARLFVKLPTFLYAANIPEKENQPRYLSEQKIKLILRHLNSFLLYLESKPEWFGGQHYNTSTNLPV